MSTSAGQPSKGIVFQDGSVQTTAAGGTGGGWTDTGSVVRLVTPTDTIGSTGAGVTVSTHFIVSAGNVGIGTINPEVRLQVSSSSAVNTMQDEIYLDNARAYGVGAGNFGSALAFTTTEGGTQSPANRVLGRVGARVNGESTSSEGNLVFETRNAGAVAEKVRIRYDGNVGIGTTSPGQALEVNGGIRANTATAQPACAAATRGTFWVVQGGAGVKDNVQVCAKDAADAYAWRVVY